MQKTLLSVPTPKYEFFDAKIASQPMLADEGCNNIYRRIRPNPENTEF
jgi:hypothetical protein